MNTLAKLLSGIALVAGILFASTTASAAPAAAGANLSLASSLIASGGGPGSYSTVRAFDAMIGSDAVLANERQIATTYGQSNEDHFVHMFDYAIADAWQLAGKNNVSLPPPSGVTGQVLATQLLQAGIGPGSTFDAARMLTSLFGDKIATQVMADLNAKYGAGASDNFDRMADQFFHDIGQSVGMNV
ncbi:MAG TPA: hypothetical protein VK702_03260 [Candidatus Acidoferrum sp.]|jgi:hypothetical protein|nr:hypothetical protein [Candidatus Acidoferrum sp.]